MTNKSTRVPLVLLFLVPLFFAGLAGGPPVHAQAPVSVTVTSDPAGAGHVTVDGAPVTTPQTFSWSAGSTHTLVAAAPTVSDCGDGCRHDFGAWLMPNDQESDNSTLLYVVGADPQQTVTASYDLWYRATIAVGPGGSGQNFESWGWPETGDVFMAPPPLPGYYFVGWAGAGNGSYTGPNPRLVVMYNGPITETADYASSIPVQVTVTSGPSTGTGYVVVDGTPAATPQVFSWMAGDAHTLTAVAPVSCGAGCRWNFTEWTFGASDYSFNQTMVYRVPGQSDLVNASYFPEYRLRVEFGAGSANRSYDEWGRLGDFETAEAFPAPGYYFVGWTGTGNGSYTGPANPIGAQLNGPLTEAAAFARGQTVTVTVDTSPSGYPVLVDGAYTDTPQAFTWGVGTTHTLGLISITFTACADSTCQYSFQGWSDGGAATHTITVTASTTYTATYSYGAVPEFPGSAGATVIALALSLALIALRRRKRA